MQGHVYAKRGGYGIRWRDSAGVQRRRTSPTGERGTAFATKRAAREWLHDHLASGVRLERMTFAELVEKYLATHDAAASTLRTLRFRLARPLERFGAVDVRELETMVDEIIDWRSTLPAGSAYGIVSAFRQVCESGVRRRRMASNPVRESGPNRQPRRGEIMPLEQREVDAIASELGAVFGPLVVFAAETALRPSEWLALTMRDVQPALRVCIVERAFGPEGVKPHAKTDASRRSVPLSRRALEAFEQVRAASDPRGLAPSSLVFPDSRGGHLDLDNWRRREWVPALEAAGVRRRRIYDLRHTGISEWLAAGLSVFEVSRYAGTSLQMISTVYGHLTFGALDTASNRLDEYAARACATSVPLGTGRGFGQ